MAAATTTIFRFISIRNPRKPTDDEIDTGFVHHTDDVAAPLLREVSDARTRKETRAGLHAILKRYRDGKDYLRTTGDVEKQALALLRFGEFLARNNTTITKAAIEQYLHDNDVKVVPAVLQTLWSNLLTHTFIGGMPETREAIIGAIRAAKVVKYPRAKLTDEVARRLALATVVLPSSVQINGEHLERKKPHDALSPDKDRKRIDAVAQRLAAYRAAHDELTTRYRDELETERAKPVTAPQLPRRDALGAFVPPAEHAKPAAAAAARPGTLDEQILRRLSEQTRSVLSDLQLPAGARVQYALKRIEEAAAKEGRELWINVTPSVRVVESGGSLWAYEPQAASHTHATPMAGRGERVDLEYGGMYETDVCRVKPLGIADFRRVEQQIWCYQPGEVAHIENVMIGETRERDTRFLHRTENTLTTSTDEETTKERDTQTTDRFEIEKESEKVVKDDLSFTLGVQVTAQYGVVKLQADTNFAYAHSTSESDKASSKYAKEVTDRAMERVVKRVREEQIQKVIEEYEENNKHGFTNAGAEHIVGLYRWVDKIYQAKIVNYGKRLMFEFIVPEPAAFHLFAMTKSPIESTLSIEKPIDPRSDETTTKLNLPPLKSHKDLSVSNYALWAAAYEAKIDPIPEEYITVTKAYNRDGLDQNVEFSDAKTDFKVPDGYEGYWFSVSYGLHSQDHDGGPNWITVFIGTHSQFSTSGGSFTGSLSGEDDFIPIAVMGRTRMYGLAIEVLVHRKPQTYETWQIKTYDAIIKGYNDKLGAYQTALAEAQARADSQIKGTNPELNRQIEQMELKKACIRLMDINCDPVASEAMKDNGDCGYPEFDCCEAMRDASYVQFVEQAFEWELMTYLFYPYFWGRKCNWSKLYQLDDPDPLFLAFLQAGFARVVVPVREGYNDAALRFIVDNQPWNGGSAPGVDSPMYLSIANEMKEPVGEVDPSVAPWEIRVPTTLTVLQAESGAVPGTGLPCPGEDGDEDHP